MRKIIVSIFIFMLIGVAFLYANTSYHMQKGENFESGVRYSSHPMYMDELNTLEELVELSNNIIIGVPLTAEKFNDSGIMKYEFKVKKEIKGVAGSVTIDVYALDGTYKEGDKYLLFLESFDLTAFPRTSYNSASRDVVINLSNKSIKSDIDSPLAKNIRKLKINEKDLSEHISKLPQNDIIPKKVVNQGKEKSASNEERITISDVIVLLTPTEITLENKNVKYANYNVEKVFKGQLDNSHQIAFSLSIETGKSYFVFLKEDENGSYFISTRQDSVIEIDENINIQELTNGI